MYCAAINMLSGAGYIAAYIQNYPEEFEQGEYKKDKI
jgi:hypothetical protein